MRMRFERTNVGYDSSASLSSNNNSVASEFGRFQDCKNWIECESMSNPGQIYFLNLRTLCTTEQRPVSHDVKLQRYRERLGIYEKNFTSDPDIEPTIVSSDRENDRRLSIDENNSNCHRSFNKIIAWMYRGVDPNGNDCLGGDQNDWTDGVVSNTSKTVPGKQDACSANADYDKVKSNDAADTAKRNVPPTDNDGDPLIDEKRTEVSCSSPKYCCSPELVKSYFIPRLPRIRKVHLLREAFRPEIKKRISKKKTARKKLFKVVSEMYGTKTINYDPLEQELPPGVKTTNLSDSSMISSLCRERAKSVDPVCFRHKDIDIGPTNLSSDSTTSSSCSSCSCCSTCCNNSEKSVSSISKKGEK